WRRADQEFMQDAQVSLPDHADSLKDGDEKHALREDSRGHKAEIVEVSGGNCLEAREHLAEDEEPQRRLQGAGENLSGITAQLAQLHISKRQSVAHEIVECSHWLWVIFYLLPQTPDRSSNL